MSLKRSFTCILAFLMCATFITGCSKTEETPTAVTESSVETNNLSTETTIETTPVTIDDIISVNDDVYTVHGAQLKLGEFNFVNKLDKDSFVVEDSDVMDYLNYRLSTDLVQKNVITEGEVAENDTLILDYVGIKTEDNSEFANDTDVSLTIGSNTFIPGFKDGLIGKKIGDTVELDLTFPDDYWSEDMRGVNTKFTVTIKSKEEVIEQEINDDFIAKNFDYNTLDEFKEAYKAEQQQYLYDNQSLQEAFNYLDEYANTCEWIVDSSVYAEEIFNQSLEMYTYYASMYGVTLEDYVKNLYNEDMDTFQETEKTNANVQARRLILISALSKQHNLEVTDEIFDEMLTLYITSYYGEDYSKLEEEKATLSNDANFKTSFTETILQVLVLRDLFNISPEIVFTNNM